VPRARQFSIGDDESRKEHLGYSFSRLGPSSCSGTTSFARGNPTRGSDRSSSRRRRRILDRYQEVFVHGEWLTADPDRVQGSTANEDAPVFGVLHARNAPTTQLEFAVPPDRASRFAQPRVFGARFRNEGASAAEEKVVVRARVASSVSSTEPDVRHRAAIISALCHEAADVALPLRRALATAAPASWWTRVAGVVARAAGECRHQSRCPPSTSI